MAVERCDYVFSGKVIKGNHIGHKMGIPTVNIAVNDKESVPTFGVYAATVDIYNKEGGRVEATCNGIANIGIKPTIEVRDENGHITPNPIGIEVNLFDFDDDLYGEAVEIRFLAFIRKEMKFNNIEELKNQINEDIQCVRNWFDLER